MGQTGGIAIRGGPIQLRKTAEKCEKLRESAKKKLLVPQPNLPKLQGATLLHRWLRIFLYLSNKKLRKNAKNCGEMRKIANRNPRPPSERHVGSHVVQLVSGVLSLVCDLLMMLVEVSCGGWGGGEWGKRKRGGGGGRQELNVPTGGQCGALADLSEPAKTPIIRIRCLGAQTYPWRQLSDPLAHPPTQVPALFRGLFIVPDTTHVSHLPLAASKASRNRAVRGSFQGPTAAPCGHGSNSSGANLEQRSGSAAAQWFGGVRRTGRPLPESWLLCCKIEPRPPLSGRSLNMKTLGETPGFEYFDANKWLPTAVGLPQATVS